MDKLRDQDEEHANPFSDHRKSTDDFVELTKKVPCGTQKRGSGKTLYEAISGLTRTDGTGPIGDKGPRRIADETVNFCAQAGYGRDLLKYHGELRNRSLLRPDFFTCFLIELLSKNPSLFCQVMRSVDGDWRHIIENCMKRESRRHKFEKSQEAYINDLKSRIQDEFGVDEGWRNLPKVGRNAATVRLCEIFTELTGKPQHGLVGQLLYRANLEDVRGIEESQRYKKLASRVATRMSRCKS